MGLIYSIDSLQSHIRLITVLDYEDVRDLDRLLCGENFCKAQGVGDWEIIFFRSILFTRPPVPE